MFYLPTPIDGCSGEPVSVQKRHSRGYEYTILKYECLIATEDTTPEVHLEPYTVITNADQTKVFAYMAPRETIGFSEFKSNYQEGDVVEVKESIEGTMITFFWNDEINEWDICTRNGVGGDYSFMRPTNKDDKAPKTFREMVLDAFRTKLLNRMVHDLNDVTLDSLSKTHCYTCILQTHSNHIVYNVVPLYSFLKLVAIYETGAMPPLVPYDSNVSYKDCVRELANPDYPEIKKSYLPKSDGDDEIWQHGHSIFYRSNTKSEFVQTSDELLTIKKEVLENYVDKMIVNKSPIYVNNIRNQDSVYYYPPAWILTNNRTGQRCEIKNPFYELAKWLRNMHPNMRYQYLYLRKNNLVGDYLRAFPRYRMDFAKLEKEYDDFVTEVHSAYVKFYIKKEREHIPKHHFVHAARIHHNVYLKQDPALPRRKVTRQTVHEYFSEVLPAKMFYLLTRKDQETLVEESEVSELDALNVA